MPSSKDLGKNTETPGDFSRLSSPPAQPSLQLLVLQPPAEWPALGALPSSHETFAMLDYQTATPSLSHNFGSAKIVN
jgi:hypothetical protein